MRKFYLIFIAVLCCLFGAFSMKISVYAEESSMEISSSAVEEGSSAEHPGMYNYEDHYESILEYAENCGVPIEENVTLEAFYEAYVNYADGAYRIHEYKKYLQYIIDMKYDVNASFSAKDLQFDPSIPLPQEPIPARISDVEMAYVVGLGLFTLIVVILIGVPILLFVPRKQWEEPWRNMFLKIRSRANCSAFFICIPLAIFALFMLVLGGLPYVIFAFVSTLLVIIPTIALARYCYKCLKAEMLLDAGKVKKMWLAFLIGVACYYVVLLSFFWFFLSVFNVAMITVFLLSISPLMIAIPLAFSAFAKARSL